VDKILRGDGDVSAMTAAKSRLEHFSEKWHRFSAENAIK
jgi:hypothetical protein